ncbi:hypothetical protein F5884DRAFT_746793 [Xylogone sp. PMI_703]|nr:hypothetical protein F5884DRAFT_746793 [Xylogone sp. PMI_703]
MEIEGCCVTTIPSALCTAQALQDVDEGRRRAPYMQHWAGNQNEKRMHLGSRLGGPVKPVDGALQAAVGQIQEHAARGRSRKAGPASLTAPGGRWAYGRTEGGARGKGALHPDDSCIASPQLCPRMIWLIGLSLSCLSGGLAAIGCAGGGRGLGEGLRWRTRRTNMTGTPSNCEGHVQGARCGWLNGCLRSPGSPTSSHKRKTSPLSDQDITHSISITVLYSTVPLQCSYRPGTTSLRVSTRHDSRAPPGHESRWEQQMKPQEHPQGCSQ